MSKLKHKLDLNTRDYLFVFDDKITLRHCEKTQCDVEIKIKDIKDIILKPSNPLEKGSVRFICEDNEPEETIKKNSVLFKGGVLNKSLDDILKSLTGDENTLVTSSASCCICKKTVNGFGSYFIDGGSICLGCFDSLHLGKFPEIATTSAMLVERKEFLTENSKKLRDYKASTFVLSYFTADTQSQLFTIQGYPDLIPFSALVNFEYIEDGNIVTSGGLGRAIAGGLLLGATGAIVGGITGGKKSRNSITDMYIRITLDYKWFSTAKIVFSNFTIKKDSNSYQINKERVEQILSSLELIAHRNEAKNITNTSTQTPSFSSADEILKLKQLLDMGVITQEEFETQKSKLLN